jgi:hypothetical protein
MHSSSRSGGGGDEAEEGGRTQTTEPESVPFRRPLRRRGSEKSKVYMYQEDI